MLHILLHFLIPYIVSFLVSNKHRIKVFVIMSATMIVDLDHLLATPIYEVSRCSIGFHPLHTVIPIVFYLCLSLFKITRWIGIGLMIHMILDSIDCQINQGLWFV